MSMSPLARVGPPPKIDGIDEMITLARAFNADELASSLTKIQEYIDQATAAYESVGTARQIVKLRAEAEADRTAAQTALADAERKAKEMVAEAQDEAQRIVAAREAESNRRTTQLASDRQKVADDREAVDALKDSLDEREQALGELSARLTAGLEKLAEDTATLEAAQKALAAKEASFNRRIDEFTRLRGRD